MKHLDHYIATALATGTLVDLGIILILYLGHMVGGILSLAVATFLAVSTVRLILRGTFGEKKDND